MKNLLKSTLIGLLIGTQAYAGLPPTTTKGANDTSNVTTFNLALPGRPVIHSGTTAYVPTPPSGGKTYISNGDFESNVTTGWTLCNTTLTGTLPTGTITNTASSFNALSTTNSSPLAGSYSLSVSSPGATTAGQGFCSSTFTIDAEDSTVSPHVQTITASYSGTANMNFSGTSSNTWAAYVYDVTNSQWIQPSGVYNFVGDGKLVATFQPNKTSSQYRLALLNVNASSGAIAMLWDSFSVGPQAVQKGPAMSDCVPYTPSFTNMGTVTGINICSYRQGDRLVIQGNVTPGAGATSLAQMSIGYGGTSGNVTIDSTKLTTNTVVGSFTQNVNSSNFGTMIGNGGNTYLNFGFQGSSFSGVTPQNGNLLSSVVTSINVSVPISGWSSNSVQSSDTDTRTVVLSAYNSGGSVTASSAITSGWTAVKDTHAAFNASTGLYTVPVVGDYSVTFIFQNTTSTNNRAQIYKNGSLVIYGAPVVSSPSGSQVTAIVPNLKVGDTLYVTEDGSATIATSTTFTTLSISRISGPAIVTATESVNCAYGLTTDVTPAGNSNVKYDTKQFDSHNAYSTSTGNFTAPTSGKYRVSIQSEVATTTTNFLLAKNGTQVTFLVTSDAGSVRSSSATISLNQGDTLSIQVGGVVGTVKGVSSGVFQNYLSIERSGN